MTASQSVPEPDRSRPSESLGRTLRGRVGDPAWLGRASAVALCLSSLGFVAGFLFVVSTGGQLALITMPLSLQVVFALPYLIALSAVGTVAGAVSGWRQGRWSLATRVHQTVLAVLAVLFVWQLFALGFLP